MALSGCIGGEDLRLFVAGQSKAAERAQIESHLSDCRACRQRVIAEYRESQAEAVSVVAPDWLKSRVLAIPKDGPGRLSAKGLGWRRQMAAVAAVVIVTVLLGAVFLRSSFRTGELPKNDAVRQEGGISASPQLLSPAGGAQVTTNEIEFRCSEVQGAEGYVFTFLSDKGDIVFRTSTKEPLLKLKAAEVRLESGKTYFWYVSAKLPAGAMADSEVSKFVLSFSFGQ